MKITSFFEEVERLRKDKTDAVPNQRLFALWESVHKPVPFKIDGADLRIGDATLSLGDEDVSRLGRFEWNHQRQQVALVVEEPSRDRIVLLNSDDGAVNVREIDPIPIEDESVSEGDVLEVMYDLIHWFRSREPGRDVLKLTKKAMTAALPDVRGGHSDEAVQRLRRLPAAELKRLLRQASGDMAVDELSAQLSLPLDGTYAVGSAARDEEDGDRGEETVSLPERGPWTILNEVRFLALCRRVAADAVRAYVLPFKGAERLEAGDDVANAPLRFGVGRDVPVRDGDRLPVHARGVNRRIGWFHVDLYDGDAVYGRFSFPLKETGDSLDRLYARPQRGPEDFLASITAEVERIVTGDLGPASGGLAATLGMGAVSVVSPPPDETSAAGSFDASQRRAWAASVNSDNPVVLVQGPPGTGKTTVLARTLRSLCAEGRRILVTAPSHAAVDNICLHCQDLPLLRFGANESSIHPSVVKRQWVGIDANVIRFKELREELGGGGIYAGTHVGLGKDGLIAADLARNGVFDVVIFDEAGMSRLEEFLACAMLGQRLVLFGDHRQLPPFPLPEVVMTQIGKRYGAVSRPLTSLITMSALEWLAERRGFPTLMLQRSYRCQNPRLLRFASTLFYDAKVKPSRQADYFKLSYDQRQGRYPPSTLRFYDTSVLGADVRGERLTFYGKRPGFENPVEANVCRWAFMDLANRLSLKEISVISPYRRQVRLIRELLTNEWKRCEALRKRCDEGQWKRFVASRVATVDGFQGGESDAVIISYVRSNPVGGVGFVDTPNRVNVAHTRCRRELVVVGDLQCLKARAGNDIFKRMERAFRRDGEIIELNDEILKTMDTQRKESA